MSLGSIVSDAANAALGIKGTSHTTLQDFLTKFSDSAGKYANSLNPLNTFEVSFKFQPTLDPTADGDDSDWLSRLGSSLKGAAIGAAKNLVNNVTGGLLGSLFNDKNGVIKAHNKFETEESGQSYSFMHYLAAANLLVGDENEWFGAAGQAPKPLEIQLGYYVQDITIPQLKIPDGGKATTLVGEFPVNGAYVIPDTNTLQMTILNTKLPLTERIFYPWMREVCNPYWAYTSQPYTTATITVDFTKHTDLKYVFCGCRPSNLQMIQANQENDQSFKRQVSFIFDFMFITSELTTMESTTDKLLGAGKTVFNAASNMVNFNSSH